MSFALDFLLKLCPGGGFRVTDVPQSEGDALIWLYKRTNGPNWTNHTNWLQTHTVANWFGVTVAGGHVTVINLVANNLNGNIGGFSISQLTSLLTLRFNNNALITGDVSGWLLPATMVDFRIGATGITGDVSGWLLPASLATLYIHLTTCSGTPDISSNTAMENYRYEDCGLVQANVNAILLSIYNRRMAFTFATPALNVGGTNLAPSGVYGAACPPGTGKEYAFELVNDSCGSGHIKWAVTFTP